VERPATGLGWPTRVSLGVAALWGAGLVIGALVVSTSTSEVVSHTPVPSAAPSTLTISRTLVEEHGLRVLIPVAIPLVAALLLAAVLRRRAHRGRVGAGVLGWSIVGVLGATSLVGMLTVGPLFLPALGLLVVGAALAEGRSEWAPTPHAP